jgi:hypothetical protein
MVTLIMIYVSRTGRFHLFIKQHPHLLKGADAIDREESSYT